MRDLGFNPCRAYDDVWMRKSDDTSNLVAITEYGLPSGEWYYEYILIHVNDFMVASQQFNQVIQAISKNHKLKKYKNTGLPYGPTDV